MLPVVEYLPRLIFINTAPWCLKNKSYSKAVRVGGQIVLEVHHGPGLVIPGDKIGASLDVVAGEPLSALRAPA